MDDKTCKQTSIEYEYFEKEDTSELVDSKVGAPKSKTVDESICQIRPIYDTLSLNALDFPPRNSQWPTPEHLKEINHVDHILHKITYKQYQNCC